MKKLFALLLISLVFVACSKKSDDSTSTSSYSNKLTLGSGLNQSNPFELTGVGTSFPVSSVIYFKLVSADDMGGSKIRIQIDKSNGTPYTTIPDYDNPQSYGHIFLSGFSLPDAGSYKATGILVNGTKTIATVNFTLN